MRDELRDGCEEASFPLTISPFAIFVGFFLCPCIALIIFKQMLFLKETITKESLYKLIRCGTYISKWTIKCDHDYMRELKWGLEGRKHGSIRRYCKPIRVPSPSGSLIREIWCDHFHFHWEPCFSTVPFLSYLVGFSQAQGSWHGCPVALPLCRVCLLCMFPKYLWGHFPNVKHMNRHSREVGMWNLPVT